MTAHQTSRIQIIARQTQDGYDWPTPRPAAPCLTCAANHYCPEHNPEPVQPMAPYFRAQLLEDSYEQMADVPVWRESESELRETAQQEK